MCVKLIRKHQLIPLNSVMTLPSEVTWDKWSSASSTSSTHQPHLWHEAVCVGVLLILEHDVRVVVAHELVEALGVACDLALCSPAGAQVVLWEVGEELLVVHGRELPGPGPDAVAGARSASLDGPCTSPRNEQAELCQAGPPGLLHWGVSGSTVPVDTDAQMGAFLSNVFTPDQNN